MTPSCAVGPDGSPSWFAASVAAGSGTLAPVEEAEALIWYHGDRATLAEELGRATKLRWVQLSAAGIEEYAGLLDPAITWTCAKRIYADAVAEHALALALAGFRGLPSYARAESWTDKHGINLFGAKVVVLGGGGIAEALLELLRPFGVHATVVRRHPAPMPGVQQVTDLAGLHEALPGADLVVVALALTPETTGVIGERELELMSEHAWLVNVARGAHVVTEDLVAALQAGAIGGARLDVTDPEPLPAGHPLWRLQNCIVTPHTANAPDMHRRQLERFTRDNVRRFAAGEPLEGIVHVELGY